MGITNTIDRLKSFFKPEKKSPKECLIPVIRKTAPSLIASSIIGVQPMTAPIGTISGGKKNNHNDLGEPFIILVSFNLFMDCLDAIISSESEYELYNSFGVTSLEYEEMGEWTNFRVGTEGGSAGSYTFSANFKETEEGVMFMIEQAIPPNSTIVDISSDPKEFCEDLVLEIINVGEAVEGYW